MALLNFKRKEAEQTPAQAVQPKEEQAHKDQEKQTKHHIYNTKIGERGVAECHSRAVFGHSARS